MPFSPCWSSSEDSSAPARDTTNTASIRRLFNLTEEHHMRIREPGLVYLDIYQPIPQQPLWLTDRHLSPQMALDEIVCLPAIPPNMLKDFEDTWTRFLSENTVFPQRLPKYLSSQPLRGIDGPSTILRSYGDLIANQCCRFISKIYVHPNQTRWETAFRLQALSTFDMFLKEVNFDVNPASNFGLPKSVANALNPAIAAKLRYLRDNRESLAIFNFIPPCSSTEDMFSASGLKKDCEWTISATHSSFKLPPFTPPNHADAKQKWWSECDPNSANQKCRMRLSQKMAGLKKSVWVPPHKGTRREYQLDTAHFLQRTWCRAVESDATFVILNMGNCERIGIRHRATKTLFLTPPLDPFQPLYMRHHMALYAAIIDDAFSRLESNDNFQNHDRKRRAPGNDTPKRASKRLKGETPATTTVTRSPDDVETEIASRHVLLVSFDFGPFHSPAPSSFLRASPSCHPSFVSKSFPKPRANRKYSLTQCLNFVAKEKVGHGATGTVYRGYLEMETSSGRILDENVVLKIPLGTKPVDRIHQEYAVYKQLAEAGVTTGVAKVYGVFEDVETGSVGMMMQYVGTNLLSREPQQLGAELSKSILRQVTISQREFDELLNIIKGINDADILHNDIKPDNILVDGNGRLFIIDFDTARPMYPPGYYKVSPDIRTLQDMFAGKFVKDKHYVR